LAKVPLEKLPKVVNSALLQRAIIIIFLISTALSAISVILVAVFIQDKKKSKAKKKTEGESKGAVAAKVSSYNLASRSKTMGILETGVDSADLIFPQIAGLLFQRFGLPLLMIIRGAMALLGEIYTYLLLRKSRFR
jgi:hypothetical protein